MKALDKTADIDLIMINFKSVLTSLGLFYAWKLGNPVHRMFIFIFLCSCLRGFLLSNANNFKTGLFEPYVEPQRVKPLRVIVNPRVMAMKKLSIRPQISRTEASAGNTESLFYSLQRRTVKNILKAFRYDINTS